MSFRVTQILSYFGVVVLHNLINQSTNLALLKQERLLESFSNSMTSEVDESFGKGGSSGPSTYHDTPTTCLNHSRSRLPCNSF